MDSLIIDFLSGISFGMILFLMACGLSLIMGVMGIANLAHGTFFMSGAFMAYTVVTTFGGKFSYFLAALGAAIVGGLVGLIVERLFLRYLNEAFDQVLLTIGVVYVLDNIVLWIWGGVPKFMMPPASLSFSIKIGHLSFPAYNFVFISVGLMIAIALWWFQEKTRIGAIVRAGMDDKEMVESLGINYRLTGTVVFFAGASMAGLAGFFGASSVGMHPEMSWSILVVALCVIIIGGMGSIQGALLGAVLIGLIDSFTKAVLPGLADFAMYLTVIIILLVKPTGLLGRRPF